MVVVGGIGVNGGVDVVVIVVVVVYLRDLSLKFGQNRVSNS